jgi:hypothetical protein
VTRSDSFPGLDKCWAAGRFSAGAQSAAPRKSSCGHHTVPPLCASSCGQDRSSDRYALGRGSRVRV